MTTSSVPEQRPSGARPAGSFGPSALATPANALTAARLLLAPVVIVLIVDRGAAWSTLLVWIAVAASDALDGWVARRQGSTSSGAFLDPLADKVLVLGALVALVAEGVFWWVPVALIAVREVVISGYRSYVGRQGISVPARRWAKVKTVTQEVAVGFALLPLTSDHTWVATFVLWIAVALTLVTGVQYLLDGRRSQQRAV
ncbi:MAG: CDP-diacylglycerol--glycerol-3-phosphate 3-phosphatidyltransferase [Acidimicrobiia bacterium]|nr:CDP-diacylglycerol--glycerol-3-phosphate 3-phosphatidyltransferase [Acidimicrobiia bacterium]